MTKAKKADDLSDMREQLQKEHDMATDTLKGDIRDFLLDSIRHVRKPWPAMSEGEQEDAIERATNAAQTFTEKCVAVVAARGTKFMIGKLDSVTAKDGIKAVIKLSSKDEMRHELLDAQGQQVVVIPTDVEFFCGERGPADVDADQPDLIIGKKKSPKPSEFLEEEEEE